MKNMMRLLFFALCACMSCTQDAVVLSIDRDLMAFSSEGGEQTLVVISSDAVSAMPEDDWVSVEKGMKEGNRTAIKISVQPNPTTSERVTRVSVLAGRERKHVKISQAAGSFQDGTLSGQLPSGLGLGWNLGNHFDAYNNAVSAEDAWGNPKATQATFHKVKAAGFNSVRIPVTWLGHIGDAPDYKIQDAWLDRVAEVVSYAEKAGLYAIVNIHHDGADSKYWLDIKAAAKDPVVQKRTLEQIEAVWTQIAMKFKDKGDFLILEGFNEIHDGGWGWGANLKDGGKQYKCLNEWNQMFVSTVRGAGEQNNMERILGIPAYSTNVDLAIEGLELPVDYLEDRLMISVHCYDPYDYTLPAKYSEWGHTAVASKKVPGDNEGDLRKSFVKLYDNYISKGIPVYFGEFGCVNRATAREQAFQQYYLKYFAKLAKVYGVPSCIWDNGAKGHGNESHAFIDHGTGDYCSPEAEAAIKALVGSYNDDKTLEQVYNNAPR